MLPVKPESVQESREAFHHHQNGDGQERPRSEDQVQHNGSGRVRLQSQVVK